MSEQRKERHYSDLSQAELDAWDAEIEADFHRVVAKTTRSSKRKGKGRLIGCPMALYADVCRLTGGRTALTVALCLYRRTIVCRSSTVTLDGVELAAFGVDRKRGREALHSLAGAGIIQLHHAGAGRKMEATLLWREPPL
jgi:hypothetical protein